MFLRKKPEEAAQQSPSENAEQAPRKGYTPGKGTPTPKRKNAQAAHYHPVISDHKKLTKEEKKEKRKAERAKENEQYARMQEAMRTGDERYMPARYSGEVRRYARDYLDARTELGELMVPLAILMILSIFIQPSFPLLAFRLLIVMYAIFFLMIIDAMWATHCARLYAEHHFGRRAIPRPFTMQNFGRCFTIHRWRQPAPQTTRGNYPEGISFAALREAFVNHWFHRNAS
ncbi:MAG: DUF3043 domain-containing protein [Actinomycetaceae bacterium]|nr:DUF3043 domain-containing protein [Actinomycetaceae bacterium]MDY6083070.1 DUF3043 domain-containing protein [Actinomycetaceae bacterium]